jgi:2-dehydropantoate 2-reductase
MRILVLGAGAIGGYFGGRLIEAGGDVTFLVRAPRAAVLARNGLKVQSPLGDISVPVRTITADCVMQPFDLVLLSCKAYDLDDAIGSIAPAIGAQTALLPLLNGVVHIPRLTEHFGSSRVLGGIAHLAVTLRTDGIIHHLNSQCAIRFGPLHNSRHDPWTPILLDLLKRARVDAVRSLTIEQDLWDKFVFLAALAGMTCLMRSGIGTILDTSDGEHLIQQLLSECSEIAAAEGYPPNEAALTEYRALLTERNSRLTASMLRDVERGGPTEADHLLGDLARRATANRIAAPLLRVAYTHLQAYEQQRKM